MVDRIASILVPTAVATAVIGGFAYIEYLVVSHVWERWVEVVDSPTVHKWQLVDHYQHSVTTDVVWGVVLGLAAVGVAVACAYWAENWYRAAR